MLGGTSPSCFLSAINHIFFGSLNNCFFTIVFKTPFRGRWAIVFKDRFFSVELSVSTGLCQRPLYCYPLVSRSYLNGPFHRSLTDCVQRSSIFWSLNDQFERCLLRSLSECYFVRHPTVLVPVRTVTDYYTYLSSPYLVVGLTIKT